MTRLYVRLTSELPPTPVYSLHDLLRQMRRFQVSPVFRSWPLDNKKRFSQFTDYLKKLLSDDFDQDVIMSFDFGESPRVKSASSDLFALSYGDVK